MSDTTFILSRKKLIEQYNKLKSISDEVSYSVKTNIEVAKILEEATDSKFSIHFEHLAKYIKDKSKITFLAQGWSSELIDKLMSQGIRSFVVDNEQDLNTLLNYLKSSNKKINLLLRMRLKEHSIHTGKHYVFGMYSDEINEFIPTLRNNKKIEKLGIHFHRKTQNTNEWSLIEELRESLSEETIDAVDMLNMGGGLPVRYKNYSVKNLDNILRKIKDLKEYLNRRGIKLIVEPGRFLAAPPIKLVTKIKQIINKTIIVDCSIFNAAMDTFIADTRLLVEDELESGNFENQYLIKGCTPDSRDILRYKVYLKNPKVGDKIVFLNAGAYNFSTDFCKLDKPETEVVD